jgi:hypothetical protein
MGKTACGWIALSPRGKVMLTYCGLTKDEVYAKLSPAYGATLNGQTILQREGYRVVRCTVTVEEPQP